MIVFRCPQARTAAKKPEISMSCFNENRCGMLIGSSGTKSGLLNCSYFSFSKSTVACGIFNSLFEFFDDAYHYPRKKRKYAQDPGEKQRKNGDKRVHQRKNDVPDNCF